MDIGLQNFFSDGFQREIPENGFVEQGVQSINGAISFQFYPNNFSFYLNPQYGYFVSNNWLLGLNTTFTNNTYQLSPYLRYYWRVASDRFFVTAEASIARNQTQSDAFTYTGLGFTLGVSYFLSSNLALESSVINYQKQWYPNQLIGGGVEYKSVGLTLGVKYFITPKHESTSK